jgi:hypothetical protein
MARTVREVTPEVVPLVMDGTTMLDAAYREALPDRPGSVTDK